MRFSQPVTVTFDDLQQGVDAWIKSGGAVLRQRVQEALDDPRPPIPADQVFAELRAHHAGRMKAAKRGG